MATYVNNLRLMEIATGAESGTWGTKTNTNLELIADAFGSGTEAITTNADTHTTTIADGAADEGRAIFLKYTGTLDSACTITLAPNDINKLWLIENATSGSQNIIISQGSGANITIGNGKVAAIFTDGAGSGAAVLDAFADLELSSTLTVAGASTLTGAVTAAAGITMTGTTPTLTIGDAGAEDTKIVFDGNAQDYYVGLDDTADDLVIGKGSTLGTTQAVAIDENLRIGIGSGVSPVATQAIKFGGTYAAVSGDANIGVFINHALTGTPNEDLVGLRHSPQMTEAGSGTHTNIFGLQVSPSLTGAGASVGNTASLYVAGAMSGATNNYAFWVDAGASRFDGNVSIGAITSATTPLHVEVGAPSSADKEMAIFQAEATRQISLGWDDSVSAMAIGAKTNNHLTFFTNGITNPRMTINNSGVVFVNTTGVTPPGAQKFIVSNNGVQSTTEWQMAIEGNNDSGILFIEDSTKRGLVGYDAGETQVMLGDNDADNRWSVATGGSNNIYGYVNNVQSLACDTAKLQISNATDPYLRLYSNDSGNKYANIWVDNSAATLFVEAPQSGMNMKFSSVSVETLFMDASSVVVNDGGVAGVDFRVEADLNANMIHIDATNRGRFGMGAAPDNNAWFYAKGEIIADYWSGGTNSVYYFDGKAHASVDDDAYVFRVHGDLVEAASGTHAIFAGAYFDKPAITSGSATVTKSTNVYIKNAGTGGTYNYSLYVNEGTIRLGPANEYTGIGTDDPLYGLHLVYLNDAIGQRRAAHIENGDDDTPEGLNIHYSNSEPNNAAYPFLQCSDENTATRLAIWSNGGVVNVGNSYGATSDRILKQDIVDANSQWDDVKALAAMGKNYRFIADVESQGDDAITHIGLVAQDVETVSPGLVDQVETERDGLMPKELKYSVMYMKAFLALGEAMNRIEDLESRIEALEA